MNRILVAAQDGDLPPRGNLPDAGGLVVGRGDHDPAVGAIDGRRNYAFMATQNGPFLPRGGVPQPGGLVIGNGDDGPAIGAGRRRFDDPLVTAEDFRRKVRSLQGRAEGTDRFVDQRSTSAATRPTTAARRRPRSGAAPLRACSISRCFSASIRRCSSATRASSWAIEALMKGRMSSISACGRDNSSRASSSGRPGASRRESLSVGFLLVPRAHRILDALDGAEELAVGIDPPATGVPFADQRLVAHLHRLVTGRLVKAGGKQPRISEKSDHRLRCRIA
ncbi:MAG: hypothetical protein M3436_13560 [Pseudomonadota bacterium]|nr:hypothetical protein [Pseudomonadota bacterium]